MMSFDFSIFERMVSGAYRVVCTPYTLPEVLAVFHYFLATYTQVRGEEHPPLRREQVERFIRAMPYFYPEDNDGTQKADIKPIWYPDIIDNYFSTFFPRCNYRMNHFFSGKVRENRVCEAVLRGGWI